MIEPMHPDTRLMPEEAARYLGGKVTTRTLQNWRTADLGPRFLKIRRQVQYRVKDLDEYLRSCEVDPAWQRRRGA